MAAEITPARITELVRDAQIAFCLDKYPSFEVALVRKVEAALATQQATQGAEPMGFVHYRSTGLGSTVREAVLTPAGLELPDGARLYTSPPPTAEVEKLREALALAVDHIDMDALRVSHCKDAAAISAALQSDQAQAGKGE